MLKHYPLFSVINLLIFGKYGFKKKILYHAEVADMMPYSTIPCVVDLI